MVYLTAISSKLSAVTSRLKAGKSSQASLFLANRCETVSKRVCKLNCLNEDVNALNVVRLNLRLNAPNGIIYLEASETLPVASQQVKSVIVATTTVSWLVIENVLQ